MGQTVLVASGKGGVGKSTVTCTVAQTLVSLGKRVLVIDGDAGLRCQDILLGLSDRVVYDWADVLCGNVTGSDAVISTPGLPDLLPAPLVWQPDFTAEDFAGMVSVLAPCYDHVFIDAPAGIGPGLDLLSKATRLAIVVSSSDAAGIRGACAAGDALKSMGLLSRRLVINSVKPALIRQGIFPDLDSVIDRTELRLIGILPYDEGICRGAAAGNVTLDQNSLFYKAALALSRRVDGDNVPITKF